MARLGSRKRPAVVRVHTMEEADAVLEGCDRRGWKVIVGLEPGKPRDVSDYERLLDREGALAGAGGTPAGGKPPRPPVNAPCPCGSGRKYKRCCGRG